METLYRTGLWVFTSCHGRKNFQLVAVRRSHVVVVGGKKVPRCQMFLFSPVFNFKSFQSSSVQYYYVWKLFQTYFCKCKMYTNVSLNTYFFKIIGRFSMRQVSHNWDHELVATFDAQRKILCSNKDCVLGPFWTESAQGLASNPISLFKTLNTNILDNSRLVKD